MLNFIYNRALSKRPFSMSHKTFLKFPKISAGILRAISQSKIPSLTKHFSKKQNEKDERKEKIMREEAEKIKKRMEKVLKIIFEDSPKGPFKNFNKFFLLNLFLFSSAFLFAWLNRESPSFMPFSEFAKNYVAKGRVESLSIIWRKAKAKLKLETDLSVFEEKNDADRSESITFDGESDFSDKREANTFKDKLFGEFKKMGSEKDHSRKNVAVYAESLKGFIEKMADLQDQLGIPKNKQLDIISNSDVASVESTRNLIDIISSLFWITMNLGFVYLIYKTGSSSNSIGNMITNNIVSSKPKPAKSKVRLSDVAGLRGAKNEMKEFVDFLKHGERYRKLGARIPKGALLVGPPGTGKTLLAKAIAGEANCPFYSASGSEFLEIFVGVGASKVRKLFKTARENAPSMIFIDEIDAVAKKRHSSIGRSHSEGESTLNQLLIEMDGFAPSTGVIVFGGTNFPESLDSALLRPGRFDRRIHLDLPDLSERKDIFEVHLRKIKLAMKSGEIASKMAALTPQFSGADIANICNEAAIFAGRKEKKSVETIDFFNANDRIIAGLETGHKPIPPAERKHIAYHEAGHAVASWFSPHADPLLKVTVVPRTGGVMGFAQYLPKEIGLMSEEEVQEKMCVALGGRAAELLFFGHLSSGASNDLENVTKMAYGAVRVFGFSSLVGNLSYPPHNNLRIFPDSKKPFSSSLGDKIDKEVQRIVREAFAKTMVILEKQKLKVEKLAEALLEKETLNHRDVIEILGEKPIKSEQYKNYLDTVGTT